jgi:ethanolamine utilization protein EutQ (cupin superfamily)
VLLLLEGELTVTLDGIAAVLAAGDVVLVPAGSELRLDGGKAGATAWVTTTPGLEAVMADGSRIAPPWAN